MATIDELYKESETLRRAGKVEEAIAVLEQVQALDETHVLSHLALAVLLGKAGRHLEAVKHAERAVELEPKETFNFTALSVTYQRAFEATQDRQFIRMAEDAKARSEASQWQR